MRKRNILLRQSFTLLFMLIGVFLFSNLAYSASGSLLRPNLGFSPDQKSDTASKFEELTSNQTAGTLDYLFSEESKMTYQVFSDDKELGDIVEEEGRYFSQSEKDSFFTPAGRAR